MFAFPCFRRVVVSLLACAGMGSSTLTRVHAEDPNQSQVIVRAPQTLPASGVSVGGIPEQIASIDLPSALALAGVRNPQLLIARQRVVEAVALRQLAAAQILPNLNLGMNYDDHTGVLQQSSGRIIQLHRQALYVGAGANAIGAGTVNIPGLQYNLNVSQSIFGFLTARQTIRTQELNNAAARNDIALQVCLRYVELMRAEALRAITLVVRDESAEVARITENFAKTGEGRKSDANRAATELFQRDADIVAAESDVLIASARLCQLLNLDPSVRLHVSDGWMAPDSLVPEPIPLSELIAIGMVRRPELQAQQSAVREAFLSLRSARILPFSPQVMLGASAGGFGGGSNRQDLGAASSFSDFKSRADLDVILFWTLQNMGIGNRAQIEAARARLGVADYQQLAVLDRVRLEIASAHARTHARYAQLEIAERSIFSATHAFREDLTRIRSREGLPIEVLDSLRLLSRARTEYLNVISDYNRAHFELYVALGQPPADMLARPVPLEVLTHPGTANTLPPGSGEPIQPGVIENPLPPKQ